MISHPTNSPPKHNDTFDKQGGDSTSNEYYHLTEEQIDILEHVTGKHNDLNDIQGGSSGEYYHLTSAEHTVVQNTSGVNTGDQESSDFDHNQLQNTHNLTSDIDHNEINNLQGGDSTSSEYYHFTVIEKNKALRESSEGTWTSPTWVDNHDGTITINGDGEYNLNSEIDGSGNVVQYSIEGDTFDASNQVPHYIYADYNNGSPILGCTENYLILNGTTRVPILIIFYNTVAVPPSFDVIDWGEQGKAVDTKTKLRFLFASQPNGVEDNGFLLTVFDTKKIRISEARRWYGLERISYEEFETGQVGHYLREWVKDGAGNWAPTTVTEYDNQNYQNPAGGKSALTHNYGVLWVYRKLSTTDPLGIVAGYIFGTTSYSKLSDAQLAVPPSLTEIPPIFVSFGIFVGRIIIDKRQDAPVEIDSAFHYEFGASIPDHNDTLNKQGGDEVLDEFYHLTSEEYSQVQLNDHNIMNNIQGGDSTSDEYYHLTSYEYNIVQNTSGVNTGDQESSDFDHNQLQNTHNLTTDIDHNSITNTHNLTTNIDHNSITNTHNLTTNIDHNSITNTHNLTTSIDHDSITNTHNLTTDIDHNLISNLQGGDSTSNEYYHLDETNYNNLISGSLNISLDDNVNITGNISKYAEFYDSLNSNIIRTLPDASLNIGKLYFFKKADSSLFTVAITPLGGDFIDGETDAYLLETEGEFVQLLARNATSWEVVSE